MEDKIGRPKFFQKTFRITNTKFEMILEKHFSKISNINILFNKKTFM